MRTLLSELALTTARQGKEELLISRFLPNIDGNPAAGARNGGDVTVIQLVLGDRTERGQGLAAVILASVSGPGIPFRAVMQGEIGQEITPVQFAA